MHNDYADIIAGREPLWWDTNGVPRFAKFEPRLLPDIYCHEAVLAEIACQGCGRVFLVGFSWGPHDMVQQARANREVVEEGLAADIKARALHYGDPPNVGCCPAGPTMNSVPLRVVEYWRRPNWGWVRDSSLEVGIKPDWAEDIEIQNL